MRILTVFLFLLATATLSFGQVFDEDPTAGAELVRSSLDDVGWAPVIVRVDIPSYQPEGNLSRDHDRRAQRATIVSVQDQLIQSVDNKDVRVLRRYNRLPYVALEVTETGLESLKTIPFVTFITANVAGQSATSGGVSAPNNPADGLLQDGGSSLLHPAEALSMLETASPMSMPMDTSRLVVGADVANANGCDGTGWAVAIIDSGIDLDHNAFSGRVVSEACYSTNGASQESLCPGGASESTAVGSGEDCRKCEGGMSSSECDFMPPGQTACPHGSLVAGAAVGNGSEDGVLVKGIAPESDIISIKVFTRASTSLTGCNGGVWTFGCPWVYASDLMKGIERVVELAETINIAAINISVDMTGTEGGPGYGTGFSSPCDGEAALSGIKDAIDLARSYGIPTIAATGNQNNSNRINPPACLTNTIAVGYTEDGSYNADAFSDHQSTLDAIGVDSNADTFMDFWAPGEWITTAWPDKNIYTVRGSSVATPQVAGSFAALRSKGGARGIDYYKTLLEDTGVPVTDTRNGANTLKPRIDVGAACLAMKSIEGNIRILLEGAHIGGGDMAAGATLQDSLPKTQPFGGPDFASTPLELSGVDAVPAFPPDIVDWVHVGLRTDLGPETTVIERPALVNTSGNIVDFDGVSRVRFLGVDSTDYHVVVRHRNHGDIISRVLIDFSSGTGTVNFRSSMNKAHSSTGDPMKQLGSVFAMFGGDVDIDAQITASDFNVWLAQTKAGAEGYAQGDITLDGEVTAADFNIWLANTKAGLQSQVPD